VNVLGLEFPMLCIRLSASALLQRQFFFNATASQATVYQETMEACYLSCIGLCWDFTKLTIALYCAISI